MFTLQLAAFCNNSDISTVIVIIPTARIINDPPNQNLSIGKGDHALCLAFKFAQISLFK